MEKTTRLLAAAASQPARMHRVTGACAAHRAAMGEGFSAQRSGALQINRLKEMGSSVWLGHVYVSRGLPLELACECLLVVAAQPWAPGSTPVRAGTPSVLPLVLPRRHRIPSVPRSGC